VATIDWIVSDRYKRRQVPAGTTLCQEGDFGDTMYFVVQGSLQISKRVIQGADKVIATLGIGQYAGELSLLTGAQRNATIRAVEETEVVEIDQEGLHARASRGVSSTTRPSPQPYFFSESDLTARASAGSARASTTRAVAGNERRPSRTVTRGRARRFRTHCARSRCSATR